MGKRWLKVLLIAVTCCVCSAPGSTCLPADRTITAVSSLLTGASPNLPYDTMLGDTL